MKSEKTMVDKKPKVIGSKKPKIKESKSELFLRLAKVRVQKVLKALRILGNCSNRNNYEYTQEQIDSMYEVLAKTLQTTIDKFTPSKKEQETFEF